MPCLPRAIVATKLCGYPGVDEQRLRIPEPIMIPSSRTPEGEPNRCPVCGHIVRIEPSRPPGDATCPYCGCLLWFSGGANLQSLDFIPPNAIVREMGSQTKQEAITALVNQLVATGSIRQEVAKSVVSAVVHREELGSTGIGRGWAVPHAKHESVSRVIGAVGFSRSGIPFDSLDGEDVHTVVLILSPVDRPHEHMQALEQVANLLNG